MQKRSKALSLAALLLIASGALPIITNCGQAKPLTTGEYLGNSEIGDGGSRTDGANLGNIYEVVQIATATDGGFTGWVNAEYPFVNTPFLPFNDTTTDRQVPFQYSYSYPANNYKLNEAHIVVDTSRDGTDTEGILVDGVLSGRVATGVLNATLPNPRVEHRVYLCSDCAGGLAATLPLSSYYMDWSLSHYKAGVTNTFDLNLENLLPTGTKTAVNVVNDGLVQVVTGDDSPIYNGTGYEPKLFLKGITISKTPLTCVASPTYQFRNVYVHNDGNSIGQAAFSGTVVTPRQSTTTAPAGFRSVEFYFDPRLPSVANVSGINLTAGSIALTIQRAATGSAAIVINGIGVSEAGFDRNQATSVVENWNDSASTNAYFATFLSGIAATQSNVLVTLDLISLFGAGNVRDLIAQGKLNISLAGSLNVAVASNNTSARTYGTAVSGPELTLNGTYSTQVCSVPNNPDSPLSDDTPPPTGVGDETSPLVTSVQAINITSNSATIQWLTDEGADDQVAYGVGSTGTLSALNATLKTFHSVNLTGLQPYKYYYYEVRSKDGNSNLTTYATKVFRTLR